MEISEQLARYAYEYDGDWNQIAKAIKEHRILSPRTITEKYMTRFDDGYPQQLKMLRYPPWVLFYQGNLSLLHQPMMTIVGSRDLTPYGEKNTMMAADILKKKYVIVSGLAKGADAAAHQAALHGGHTIAVIGCGTSYHYPLCNHDLYCQIAEKGLILSEYPAFVGPRRHHFPWRNRMLAALGEACIVTQASMHSGTMLTVNEALSLAKDVWCFPYPYEEEAGMGCNCLIEQGAGILYQPQQLQDFIYKKSTLKNQS